MIDFSYIQSQLAGRIAGVLKQEDAVDAAVILPLVKVDNQWSVLFEVRAHHLRRQPSEICFPGGKIDQSDKNPQMAAVRELTEELGVDSKNINLIAPLDVLITPYRGVIYPFVAEIEDISSLQINKEEVDHIFTVPLTYLYEQIPEIFKMGIQFIPDKQFPLEKIANGSSYLKRTNHLNEHFYYYNDYVIWGITAHILTHFLKLTKKE